MVFLIGDRSNLKGALASDTSWCYGDKGSRFRIRHSKHKCLRRPSVASDLRHLGKTFLTCLLRTFYKFARCRLSQTLGHRVGLPPPAYALCTERIDAIVPEANQTHSSGECATRSAVRAVAYRPRTRASARKYYESRLQCSPAVAAGVSQGVLWLFLELSWHVHSRVWY